MKRYTETNKWNDAWYLNLSPGAKALLCYIYDNCDEAGFMDLLTKRMIEDVKFATREDFLASLAELKQALGVDISRKKIWLSIFLRQEMKLPLNPLLPEHSYIIEKLRRNLAQFNNDARIRDILDTTFVKKQKPVKKVKEQKALVSPLLKSEAFVQVWNLLLQEKKWRNKSLNALQLSLDELGRAPTEADAIAMMKKAIGGNYQGIFQIEQNNKTNGNKKSFNTPKPKYKEHDEF